MVKIQLASEVGDDIERILDHLSRLEVGDATERIQQILEAIAVLQHNPLIGRPVDIRQGESATPDSGLRGLVIGRRVRGYVALYRYVAKLDIVFVLALRGHREAGYVGQQWED